MKTQQTAIVPQIRTEDQRAADNAAFIVQACNNAQRLADALEKVLSSMIRYEWNADPEIKVIREALAQWEKDQ